MKRRRALLVALGALGVIILGAATTVALAVNHLTSQLDTEDIGAAPQDQPPITEYSGGFDVLLVGSDSRDKQGKNLGEGGDVTGARNDVTMLLRVNDTHDRATVISFPRDLVIDSPSCADDAEQITSGSPHMQLNTALERGGLSCVATAVESLTGVSVAYAAQVSFQGVIELSSAVGGVPVCFTGPIDDPDAGLHIPAAGTYDIQGTQALSVLRSRHGIGDGSDLARISSQQSFLSGLARTLREKATLSNPFELYSIADAAIRNMTLSTDLADLDTLISMVKALSAVPLENTTFVTYPYLPQGNRVVPDKVTADELLALIEADQPIALGSSHSGRGVQVEGSAPPAKSPGPSEGQQPSSPTTDPGAATPENVEGQNANSFSCITPN